MRRKTVAVILILALGILSPPLAADAQQTGRIYRIGYLSGTTARAASHLVEAFRQGLREFGYVENKNIVIEYRWAESRIERLPELAAELVRLEVDVILATSTPTVLAARDATRTIPIVTTLVLDPVEMGLVASLARPGGNITGLTIMVGPEIAGKWLQLLKEAVPRISRVAVLWNPAQTSHPPYLRDAEGAARSLGVQLQRVEVRSPTEFDSAFAAMTRERADAVLVLRESMFFTHRTRLADLAIKNRLPAMVTLREYVEAGGLMGYAPSMRDTHRRAAIYVDKILKGAKPADLPVEQPTRFELVINLKTAKALGLTIPQSILIRADHVIQ